MPVCNPECKSGGRCTAPNTCQCSENQCGKYCELQCAHGSCIGSECKCEKRFAGAQCEKLRICFVVPQSGFGSSIEVGNKLKKQLDHWSDNYQLDFKCNDADRAALPTLLLVTPGGRKQESISNFERARNGKAAIAFFAESQNTPGTSQNSGFYVGDRFVAFSITTIWDLAELVPFIMDIEFNREVFQQSMQLIVAEFEK